MCSMFFFMLFNLTIMLKNCYLTFNHEPYLFEIGISFISKGCTDVDTRYQHSIMSNLIARLYFKPAVVSYLIWRNEYGHRDNKQCPQGSLVCEWGMWFSCPSDGEGLVWPSSKWIMFCSIIVTIIRCPTDCLRSYQNTTHRKTERRAVFCLYSVNNYIK